MLGMFARVILKIMKTTTLLKTNMPENPNKLFLALELSNQKWKLCFSNAKRLRRRSIDARDQKALEKEIPLAKEKLGLPADAEVYSCYEAGRDGFWVHRLLEKIELKNQVFDPASIEVNRRQRRKKTDRIDAEKLVRLLMRIVLCGEEKVCAVVRVPTREQEAEMRVDRERGRLVSERTAHRARIRSLLVLHGVVVKEVERVSFANLVDWEGKPLPTALVVELEREQERLKQVSQQLRELENKQKEQVQVAQTKATQKAARLMRLMGVGLQSGWTLSHEFFWRDFNNRKQVGACAGVTGSPYDSGDSQRELGISKAGNWRVRALLIQLAWGWLKFQPQSALSHWFEEHYGSGNSRRRRVGIVALARKLLVALWKYIEHGIEPEGVVFKSQ